MKIDYFTLLSFEPLKINNVGSIISPKLKDVSKIGFNQYQEFISVLLLDVDGYIEYFNKSKPYYLQSLPKNEVQSIDILLKNDTLPNIFSFILIDKIIRESILKALNFFFTETVIFNEEISAFILKDSSLDNDSEQIIGIINDKVYDAIINIILQRVNIQKRSQEQSKKKFKNKIAEQIYKKTNSLKKNREKQTDYKFEMPNIISALSTHHQSINMINIWDLTVYQLYDQFMRQRLEDTYTIHSSSVSYWGDPKNNFNDTLWFTAYNTENL
ncbi:hypothetical protein LJC58_03835 [Lachnospiraceae bacterium OttesenSCG-928-D06]|nr:hypothetical protein [Lachnospiraceae bacterium OttesenSCG-928-D06]